ncbi:MULTISPECIES: dihydroorotase [unclassified Janthinobacterium]|uniref:dihydroorotase n=1 Tax=unclassified Janthinobacterium TaxID=2610881 RepID=UPI0008868220|nr:MULTISPECIES: dihydroorotase [unclassified Janthinobacterium]SDA47948.1 dihydroorotase [Janthinobacterium sp. 551a]SFB39453.1 dihydroorotase [Janthinobacterium sp. 344]
MTTLHIKNGHLIDPANGIDGLQDLFIADGKVIAVGSAPAGFTADTTFDAAGLVVSPGLVDLSARLREPGYEYKATLESELQAALQGGVTSLVCPPDTDPVLDEPGLVEMLKYRAKTQNKAHVHPLGALTMGLKGQSLTEMAELTEAGCIGFAQAEEPIEDTTVLLRAMQYANTFGYTVWLRPQDPHIGRGGIAHSGPLASRLGLSGVPVMSETIALHTIFELMRASRARVHLCRISSAAGLELIRAAKAEGLPVTCDVGAHHAHLTDADIGFFDPNARVTPPFRSQRDRDAIRAGLLDGTVDAMCSDHTPVDDDEKLLPFGEASPGATGLELLLSLALKWADDYALHQPQTGARPLARAVAKITADAARVAGIPAGSLGVGEAADICVFDPAARWTVSSASLASQGKHTPFLGYELSGIVKATIVAGRVAFQR